MNLEWMLEENVIKPSHQLKKMTEPLSKHFGVTHFFISKVKKSGSHTVIGGDVDVSNEYYFSNFFIHSPFLPQS